MPPEIERAHPRSSKVLGLLEVEFDNAGPDVGAADIHGKDAVMPGEDPAWPDLRSRSRQSSIRAASRRLARSPTNPSASGKMGIVDIHHNSRQLRRAMAKRRGIRWRIAHA
jgi:hypothetical protein